MKYQKEWFIKIDGKEQGPFSINELKHNRRITPDTLVRKLNWPIWVPIGQVEELKDVFKDEEKPDDQKEEEKKDKSPLKEGMLVLAARLDPGHFFIWLLIFLIIMGWVIFNLWRR